MDLTNVQGRNYPQRVTLESNIQTVTGELFSAGTEIIVLLCERLIQCRDLRDYCNVDDEAEQANATEKVFINPASNHDFLDTHCKGEVYETIEELCKERPRYFSSEKEFFTVCSDDRTVRIAKGYEFELKTVKSVHAMSLGRDSRVYNNIDATKTSNVVCFHCKNVGCDLQISSNLHNKYKFKSIEDQTNYKPKEILDRFPLPRQVDFMDEDIKSLASPYISSTEINLEKENKLCSLLFTTGHHDSELESGLELRTQIKCCELIEPSLVKVKHRVDHSQLGEQFDTIFVLENRCEKRPVFSLIGRKQKTAVSRLKTGRQPYIDMDPNERYRSLKQNDKSVDSGFDESVSSTGNIEPPVSAKLHPVDEKQEKENSKDTIPIPPIPKRNQGSADRDSRSYVDIKVDRKKTPQLPSRHYKEGDQDQVENDSTIPEIKQTDDTQKAGELTDEATSHQSSSENKVRESASHSTTVPRESSAQKKIAAESRKEKAGTKKNATLMEHFDGMTCHDLACLLRTCKLNNFAEKCIEESVDGELFLDLTDDILKDEPFSLTKLEILKVNKLKAGWRPKE